MKWWNDRSRARLGGAGLALVMAATLVGCTGPTKVAKREHKTSKAPPARVLKFKLPSDKYGTIAVKVPGEPMATVPTSAKDVDFELYTLKRVDDAVQVVFALRHPKEDYNAAYATLDLDEDPGISYHDASDVALIDTKGMKEYKTFREDGDEGRCLCSIPWNAVAEDRLPAGTRRYDAAEVAAPPTDVTQVTVKAGLTDINRARIDQ